MSGTVEEIEEHIATGKPAMIYFSSAPVHPDSINPEQYAAVQTFKQSLRQRGLYDEYESLSDFARNWYVNWLKPSFPCSLRTLELHPLRSRPYPFPSLEWNPYRRPEKSPHK